MLNWGVRGDGSQTSAFSPCQAIPILFNLLCITEKFAQISNILELSLSEVMDANRCAHTRDFSETLLSWGQAGWRDIFSPYCLIQSSPTHRQADLGKEVSRGAVLMCHFAGHIASSFSCVCFCFTLWLEQQGLSRICTFHFSSFFLCGGNLQLLLMTWCDVDHDHLYENPSVVLFPLKLNKSDQTRFVHTKLFGTEWSSSTRKCWIFKQSS